MSRIIANNIRHNDATSDNIALDSNGRVGIGEASPNRQLVINGGASEGVIQITNDTSGTAAANGFELIHFTNGETQLLNRENGAMRFDTNGTERMRILAAGGLTFNGDTATANALDDYEEGTWTPTFSAPGATFTYSSQLGSYIKIGTLVYAAFFVQISAVSGGTGTCGIGGLPFTTGNSASNPNPGGFIQLVGNWNTNHPDSLEANGSSTTVFNLNYRSAANGTNNQGVPTSNFQANTFVRATAVYFSS